MDILNENKNNKVEDYNDILLTEIIGFKNNYEKQIEKYLNKRYSTNKDFNLFLDEMYRDLYEADKIMLDWYFDEGENIFKKIKQRILSSDIEEKLYIQINSIIKGLTRIFDVLWKKNKEDRMDNIYKWIMDVPYSLLNKMEQLLYEGGETMSKNKYTVPVTVTMEVQALNFNDAEDRIQTLLEVSLNNRDIVGIEVDSINIEEHC